MVNDDKQQRPNGLIRITDWLNGHLMTALGPPNVGPYEDMLSTAGEGVCPVCYHPMKEHFIDHSTANAVLICPADHEPEYESFAPLNEVGMPKKSGSNPAM
jgi:hypothetical protein